MSCLTCVECGENSNETPCPKCGCKDVFFDESPTYDEGDHEDCGESGDYVD